MRQVDRRVFVKRRTVLRAAAAAPAAAAFVGSVYSPEAWADSGTLSPHVMATLARMARDIFPHDRLADVYYARAVAGWDGKAAAAAEIKTLIEFGVARLDADAHDRFGKDYRDVPWEADRVQLLQRIEGSPFFAKLRGDLVVSLYNQQELWAKFGYEGSSAEHGGYIHRGFDDIDWLPKA